MIVDLHLLKRRSIVKAGGLGLRGIKSGCSTAYLALKVKLLLVDVGIGAYGSVEEEVEGTTKKHCKNFRNAEETPRECHSDTR
ncbi:hypothetical protein B296_00033333 [Ensete ventricosum]|uniref:Uncharacterized protein n=1 Tax=Ensete ventricosum TaxID=4639 RepID=A0A426Y818_ENSVE|nr:hypothetical protein B296_00033333 [Ensete ventricosum]